MIRVAFLAAQVGPFGEEGATVLQHNRQLSLIVDLYWQNRFGGCRSVSEAEIVDRWTDGDAGFHVAVRLDCVL